ncbi:MAG: isoprenylcysteine carboxylmethyltransferase family protein [Acidobacteria bacterium]|nr:isoprenylcysteine carboxylmethyltransferase family protein [Acidobacteriota bacterium]
METVWLWLYLIGFALFHSFLLHPPVLAWIRAQSPKLFSVHRLLYNKISSLALLALPWLFPEQLKVVYQLSAPWFWLAAGLSLFGACLIFWVIAVQFDLFHFLGYRHLAQPNLGPVSDQPLVTRGVFAWCRHPLYFGLILALWSLPVQWRLTLHLAVFSSLYCFIGSFFEEARLLDKFGDAYRNYQKSTPRLIPFLF